MSLELLTVVLALAGQLAAIVWGAATVSTRLKSLEVTVRDDREVIHKRIDQVEAKVENTARHLTALEAEHRVLHGDAG